MRYRLLSIYLSVTFCLILNSLPFTMAAQRTHENGNYVYLPLITSGIHESSTNQLPAPEADEFFLDSYANQQLILSLPSKKLIHRVGERSEYISEPVVSARFLSDGRIIAIRDNLSLVVLDSQFQVTELLPSKSANGPLFVSPDSKHVAYLKPTDFEGGDIPFTNGIAVFDLQTRLETVLFKLPYVTVLLYGWFGDSLLVDVPYWDSHTLQPSPYMFLGKLPSDSPSTSIPMFARLPAIQPGGNYPVRVKELPWLVYKSIDGGVIVDLEKGLYAKTNENIYRSLLEAPAQLRTHSREGFSNLAWQPYSSDNRVVPLPALNTNFVLDQESKQLFNTSSTPSTALLYRPAADSVPISAYKDLDARSGYISDWTGWSSLSWVYGHAYDQHEGTDYDGNESTPVYPAQIGRVGAISILCTNTYPATISYGTNFRITHETLADGNSYATGYAHLRCDSVAVQDGGTVTSLTQQIALQGQTGYATGVHLHLNVHRNGVIVDPYELSIIGNAAS
ncbi:MAG: M23 family metallopeptidase, partial [Caldilineaceae bacterium]